MSFAPAYLPLPQAAAYCGYSADRFRRIVKEYSVPRYGPSRNRFKIADLDDWMENPPAFRSVQPARRKKFTPVTV
jgi:hypothetical protein